MADARLIHKSAGESAKVSALSDFEFRVWLQYQLAANDFGVMPAEAATLQADNRALRNRPGRKVQAALETVIGVDLVWVFCHQRQRYVWQWDWQDRQGVRWPRTTIHPAPPPADLVKASPLTQKLFEDHFARARKESGKLATGFPKSFPDTPSLAGGRDARSSTSPSASQSVGSGSSEESARETEPVSALAPAWRAPGPRAAALVRQHPNCHPAARAACERGSCVPPFIIAEWQDACASAGWDAHEAILATVTAALASVPTNLPFAPSDPPRYWRGWWGSTHGAAPMAANTTGRESATAHTIRNAREVLRDIS